MPLIKIFLLPLERSNKVRVPITYASKLICINDVGATEGGEIVRKSVLVSQIK